ncbi:MAG: cytochrome c oxidase subunit II, partial [Solirubrobacterales bacterium]|nr:cytochrome c oxidase subunit II [Solirubrobacterales bacterium]
PTEGSRQAGNVHTLYYVLLIASIPIIVLVETVVVFSVWRFRLRPGDDRVDGPPIHGNTRLEVMWTAIPAVLIVSLCTYAYTVLRSNEDSKKGEMTVNVTERQFAFEFTYPHTGGKTVVSSILYLPNNKPVVFKLTSLDVIHSFFVPSFSQKLDAVPGIVTTLRVTPTRLGTYPVECTELCGAGHALMRSAVHVVTPAALQSWLQSQPANATPPIGTPPPGAGLAGEPGAAPSSPSGGAAEGSGGAQSGPGASGSGGGSSTSGSGGASGGSSTSTGTSAAGAAADASASATAGKAIFTGSAGCGTCHTLAAAGTSGTVGPNLGTRVVPDSKKRGLPLKQFIDESITKPNAFISPGFPPNVMPQTFSQTLTPTQIQQLVDFIASATK